MDFQQQVRELIGAYYLQKALHERWNEYRWHTLHMLISAIHAIGRSLFPHICLKDNPVYTCAEGEKLGGAK